MTAQISGQPAAPETFLQATERAKSRQMPIADLFSTTANLQAAGQNPRAIELYQTWLDHNAGDAFTYAVYFNFGVALTSSGDLPRAVAAFENAIRIKPDFYPPYINLGRAIEDQGQIGQAALKWMALVDKLAVVNGDTVAHKLMALQQIARVLEGVNSDEMAEDALRQSLDINPTQVEALQHWISLRQRQCKWPVLAESERVTRKALLGGISSLSLANLADDPMFQLAKAHQYGKTSIGMHMPVKRADAALRREPLKLRVGYVSSDLREHAVGFAMTDVLELHDRSNFEIFAYYCGIKRTDPTQQRIMRAVDHWCDINGMDDDAAAAKIAADGIDILIDLNGYTKDARTKVFARRPAPIIVNWFGFPGTMGTPYHNYVIADPIIIRPEDEIYYSEKVVRLPCYQPNDRKRIVSPRKPSRAEAGLPEDAVVFCCLNGMQKLTARTFARWMQILSRVPGSVLWLLTGTKETNERIFAAAAQHGIARERIVFANKRPNPDHLARYALADLFLDNLPYGAHTTAADSLWMNVPILTLPGRSFAARVCASVLSAAGIPEMICRTPEEYVERAVELGLDRNKLSAIKAKLGAARDASLLFDTPQLVRELENLYRGMWSDLIRDALPQPDLRNLDIYHDIGLTLDLENIEAVNDADYAALYRQKLADWHAAYPIAADGRLWREMAQNVLSLAERRATPPAGDAANPKKSSQAR
jgi:predicted O-linked N-acetylglucosamine transferase (SPINDLY family)